METPIVKIRWSYNCLICSVGFPSLIRSFQTSAAISIWRECLTSIETHIIKKIRSQDLITIMELQLWWLPSKHQCFSWMSVSSTSAVSMPLNYHKYQCTLYDNDQYGGWFNKKMPSYLYRKSHCGDKTILRPSYLHSGISHTGKTTSLYWIRALVSNVEPDASCDLWVDLWVDASIRGLVWDNTCSSPLRGDNP